MGAHLSVYDTCTQGASIVDLGHYPHVYRVSIAYDKTPLHWLLFACNCSFWRGFTKVDPPGNLNIEDEHRPMQVRLADGCYAQSRGRRE